VTVTETADTALERTTARLLAMNKDKFQAVVDRDLRRRQNPDDRRAELESRALRTPAVVDRWLAALTGASKSVEGQLAARALDYDAERAELQLLIAQFEDRVAEGGKLSDDDERELRAARRRLFEIRAEYSRSRAGTMRFKSGLDEWIVEATSIRNSLRDRLYDTVVTEERNRLAERVRALEEAIRSHRDAFPEEDEPTDADEDLWNLVS
jgi:hypothetical protein